MDIKNTNVTRFPENAGSEADYITVDVSGPGEFAALTLQAHGIPHTRRRGPVLWQRVGHPKPLGNSGWAADVWRDGEEIGTCTGFSSASDLLTELRKVCGVTDRPVQTLKYRLDLDTAPLTAAVAEVTAAVDKATATLEAAKAAAASAPTIPKAWTGIVLENACLKIDFGDSLEIDLCANLCTGTAKHLTEKEARTILDALCRGERVVVMGGLPYAGFLVRGETNPCAQEGFFDVKFTFCIKPEYPGREPAQTFTPAWTGIVYNEWGKMCTLDLLHLKVAANKYDGFLECTAAYPPGSVNTVLSTIINARAVVTVVCGGLPIVGVLRQADWSAASGLVTLTIDTRNSRS